MAPHFRHYTVYTVRAVKTGSGQRAASEHESYVADLISGSGMHLLFKRDGQVLQVFHAHVHLMQELLTALTRQLGLRPPSDAFLPKWCCCASRRVSVASRLCALRLQCAAPPSRAMEEQTKASSTILLQLRSLHSLHSLKPLADVPQPSFATRGSYRAA